MPDDTPRDEASDSRDLTEGSVARSLFAMAGPMLIGLISVMSMNVVDTYFVGQLGTIPLAAMSFSFPIIFFVGGISTGLGAAGASVISRAVGRDDHASARRLTTHALMLAGALVVLLLLVGFPFMPSIFRLLGASDQVLPLAMDYMRIWLFGMLFFVVPVIGTSALRARGDAKTPMFIMLGGTIINLLLDPALIFGAGPIPALGIEGAALATAIARGIATLVTLSILWTNDQMRPVAAGVTERIGDSWRQLLRIGAPAAGTNVIAPVTTAILTRLVSTFGEPAVAAYGAGTRIESLAILVFYALSSGLSPLVGQNWGADHRDRTRRALVLSEKVAILWGLITWAIFALGADWLAGVFVEGPDAAEHLAHFLIVVPAGHAAQGVFLVGNATLNAIDRPVQAATLSLLRTLVLTAPLAWLASYWFGLPGVFGSIAVANLLVGIAAAATVHHLVASAPTGD
ncbi:MAG: MATE family efflux transporter [Bradymonadaceae bacterium]